MWSRRVFGVSIGAATCGLALPVRRASAAGLDLSAVPAAAHEAGMRLAITAARGNPAFPFGAVIVRASDRKVMASGVNNGAANPIVHGEIAAINDYVAKHGNRGWDEAVLYTTGEPCPMCMGALVWAGIGGVVYGTSIAQLQQAGIDQILIPAATVIGASPFYRGEILGGVLRSETDALFSGRQQP